MQSIETKGNHMDPNVSLNRNTLAALVRGVGMSAYTQSVHEGSATKRDIFDASLELAGRIEYGRIADVSVAGASDNFIREARGAGVL